MNPQRGTQVAAALLLDAVLGEPPEAVHPTVLMGLMISAFEKRALRMESPRSRRLVGMVLAGSVSSLMFVSTRKILSVVPCKPRWMFGTALVSTTLSMRGLGEAAEDVAFWLREGRLERARTRLGHFVGRDTDDLPESEVCRAAVESVAENTSDGIVAPMFYGALFGTPGAGIQGREYPGLHGGLPAASLRRPRMGLCPSGRSRQPGAVEAYDALRGGYLGTTSWHAPDRPSLWTTNRQPQRRDGRGRIRRSHRYQARWRQHVRRGAAGGAFARRRTPTCA